VLIKTRLLKFLFRDTAAINRGKIGFRPVSQTRKIPEAVSTASLALVILFV
jgi:hypothetical protein